MYEWTRKLVTHLAVGARNVITEVGLKFVELGLPDAPASDPEDDDLEDDDLEDDLEDEEEAEDDGPLNTLSPEEFEHLEEAVKSGEPYQPGRFTPVRQIEADRVMWKPLVDCGSATIIQVQLPEFGKIGPAMKLFLSGYDWAVFIPRMLRATVQLHPDMVSLIDDLKSNRSLAIHGGDGGLWVEETGIPGPTRLDQVTGDDGRVLEFRRAGKSTPSVRVRPCVQVHGLGNDAFANLVPNLHILGDGEELTLRGPFTFRGDNVLELDVAVPGCVPDHVLQQVPPASRVAIVTISVGLEVLYDRTFGPSTASMGGQ